MTKLTDKILAEQLPPGNYGEGLIVEVDGKYYLNLIDDEGEMLAGTKPLPPGSYRFLFTTATATEEDARKVVEKDNRGYKHYWEDKGHVPRGFNSRYKTALESLRSLLRSKNLDPNKNYAIIEKLK